MAGHTWWHPGLVPSKRTKARHMCALHGLCRAVLYCAMRVVIHAGGVVAGAAAGGARNDTWHAAQLWCRKKMNQFASALMTTCSNSSASQHAWGDRGRRIRDRVNANGNRRQCLVARRPMLQHKQTTPCTQAPSPTHGIDTCLHTTTYMYTPASTSWMSTSGISGMTSVGLLCLVIDAPSAFTFSRIHLIG